MGTRVKAKEHPKAGKRAARRAPLARVLLVEDDPVLAMTLEDAFLRGGETREVVICPTMQATMEELERGPRPDAIVIDVHLADRDDGWAIAELVAMLGPNPPRIAFSTGSPQDIPPAIAAMGPVFEKPYDPQALVDGLSAGRSTGRARGLFARMLR